MRPPPITVHRGNISRKKLIFEKKRREQPEVKTHHPEKDRSRKRPIVKKAIEMRERIRKALLR
jgi:hypothetical protein